MDKRFCNLCETEIKRTDVCYTYSISVDFPSGTATKVPFEESNTPIPLMDSEFKQLHFCKKCHDESLPDYMRLPLIEKPNVSKTACGAMGAYKQVKIEKGE